DGRRVPVRRAGLSREQVVDREPVLADEVADPAAERDPPDADRARVPQADAEPVRRGGVREFGRGETRLGPSGAFLDIDVDRLHLREVEDDPVGRTMAGDAMTAAANSELQAALTRKP